MHAVHKNQLETAAVLLEHGADINKGGPEGMTPEGEAFAPPSPTARWRSSSPKGSLRLPSPSGNWRR